MASPSSAAFSAPGSFSTALRSGSALTPNSSATSRKVRRYPPTSSRLTAKAAPPLRSKLSVTSMWPRCRRSLSTRRTFISTGSSSDRQAQMQIEEAVVHRLQAQGQRELVVHVRLHLGIASHGANVHGAITRSRKLLLHLRTANHTTGGRCRYVTSGTHASPRR